MTTTAAPRQRFTTPLATRPAGVWVAAAVLALAVLAAVGPALIASGDPLQTDLVAAHRPPSVQHPFGTDQLGRDVFTRVVHGARLSLFIGVSATALAVVIGVTLGLVAGVGAGVVDAIASRTFDLLGAFPEILLALVLIAFTGTGTPNLVLAIGIAAAPRFARVMRAETRAVRGSEYVAQAGLLTRSRPRIVVRHILPNALRSLPVVVTLGLGTSILGAAALSFLGFGPKPPEPEWGSMLAEAHGDLRIAWWTVVFPGAAITVVVLATTVLGRYAGHRFERRAQP
ncbi:peptide/nickel transport system permease protein [Nocardia amikacinitolerans]|uniref:Peptide/nickel transport system permease protein n=1 Tax=Nocardia amikacinitolerans TaxID=756689 RepID=A0A285M0L1_9NOCA|nr:ABC transporter permease [Nocardia amikacinitolerans]MCP2298562.1 peptide/nickel transport system permease protein [Nocardia amikacinitolerans]SNY89456.1 peptide/nickel transport system permease protein [Nocardia amikacinitolerans]